MVFNAKYLMDTLESMGMEEITFEVKGQLSPTFIKEADNDHYQSLSCSCAFSLIKTIRPLGQRQFY